MASSWRIWAYGSAVTAALADGALVGGWLATREPSRRWKRRRRRVRTALVGAFAAHVLIEEVAWIVAAGPEVDIDNRAAIQLIPVAGAACVVGTALEKRGPRWLARRGSRQPHVAFGVVSGALYAACTYPIWRAQARRRLELLEAMQEQPPCDAPDPWTRGS